MSSYLTLAAGATDQDSPLTGRDPVTPTRGSVMEILRERDCYLYERELRSQGTAENGFYSTTTTDLISPAAVGLYTIPGSGTWPTNGFLTTQVQHVRVSFARTASFVSGAISYTWDVNYPGSYAASNGHPMVSLAITEDPLNLIPNADVYWDFVTTVAAGVRTQAVRFTLAGGTPSDYPYWMAFTGSVIWWKDS